MRDIWHYITHHIIWQFDVSAFLVLIATPILAWLGFNRYRKPSSTPDYKAAAGNAEINRIIKELKSTIPDCALVSILEWTNGGGVPVAGKPLFFKTIFSTDDETLRIWEAPTLAESELVNLHSTMMVKGDIMFYREQLKNRTTVAWYADKQVEQTFAFLIGIEPGKRTIVLYASRKTRDVLPHKHYLHLVAATKDLLPLFRSKCWLCFKKNLVSY